MKIRFADTYEDICCGQFGFTKSEARNAIKEPDEMEKVRIDDLELQFFSKSKEQHCLIVCVQCMPDKLLIQVALKLFPDLYGRETTTKRPLVLLKTIAERFGSDLIVGGEKGRFFLHQERLCENMDPQKVIQMEKPPLNMFQSFYFKILNLPKPTLKIAVCYCVDCDAYKQYLRNWTISNGQTGS